AIIVTLLVLLFFSYRQTIDTYPNGGGAYTVARENIGPTASLLAAAALALDYLLNVAVAISAGVGALVSAVPDLLPHTLLLCLSVLLLLTVINLRGVRAAGLVFMLPTYLFLGSLFAVIGIGLTKTLWFGGGPPAVVEATAAPVAMSAASGWLLLRAFANGCTAMTGVEAVSNGVSLFRPPSEVGARRTLGAIVVCLIVLLTGIAFLARRYGVTATVPGEPGYESLLSRLTATIAGRGPLYYGTMGSVMTVLALSANTSFAGFPRVCRMLAADRFLPEPFVHRGRRLAFSHGIVVLALLSAFLLVIFRGITDRLIPLFAIGALAAFTMSQVGMTAHWRKQSGGRAKRAPLGIPAALRAAFGLRHEARARASRPTDRGNRSRAGRTALVPSPASQSHRVDDESTAPFPGRPADHHRQRALVSPRLASGTRETAGARPPFPSRHVVESCPPGYQFGRNMIEMRGCACLTFGIACW
ncbi:MAG TPA: APC family permease, partial [Polyangiaceae bacterium]|nr:APC family permease [Polyangiaceae bacterium]